MQHDLHHEFDACSVLAILEFMVNCLAQFAMILAVHSIASDNKLHCNFKFLLCMALSRTFLNFVRRCVANYVILFWHEELTEQFLHIYKYVSVFTSMLLAISMMLVALERLIFTYNIGNYENSRPSVYSRGFCAFLVVMTAACISMSSNMFVAISFLFVSPMLTLVLLLSVYRANQKRRKPHRSLSLKKKSLANQNMNSVTLFLPPMICSSVFSILHGALTLGTFIALAEEFAHDHSVMRAIVGIAIAADDFLTPSIAYFCHRTLKERAVRRIACETLDADDYFKQLEKYWKLNHSKG